MIYTKYVYLTVPHLQQTDFSPPFPPVDASFTASHLYPTPDLRHATPLLPLTLRNETELPSSGHSPRHWSAAPWRWRHIGWTGTSRKPSTCLLQQGRLKWLHICSTVILSLLLCGVGPFYLALDYLLSTVCPSSLPDISLPHDISIFPDNPQDRIVSAQHARETRCIRTCFRQDSQSHGEESVGHGSTQGKEWKLPRSPLPYARLHVTYVPSHLFSSCPVLADLWWPRWTVIYLQSILSLLLPCWEI